MRIELKFVSAFLVLFALMVSALLFIGFTFFNFLVISIVAFILLVLVTLHFLSPADEMMGGSQALYDESTQMLQGVKKQHGRALGIKDKGAEDMAEGRIKEMQLARIASLNMMEDLDSAYKELQKETALKDELFNITSHELKSPLVPIIGYVDLLMHGKVPGHLSKEQKEALDVINRNANRLSELIEDVLDIARLQSKKMKFNFRKESLNVVMKEVEQRFNEEVERKGIHLIMDVQPKLPQMMMDKLRLGQVFSNLIGNAIKFTDKGAISVHVKEEQDDIVIDVADTGIGIAKQDLPHIFDKFYQVESSLTRRHGGSGLGLAIVKGIVETHRGVVSASSELGKGAVFTVKLPVKMPEPKEEKRKINIAEKIKKFRGEKKKEEASIRRELKRAKMPEEKIASFFE